MKLLNLVFLLLIPATLFAEKNHTFSPACGTKVNVRVLRQAVRAVAPKADVIWRDCTGNLHRDGVEIPDSAQPSKLTVYRVPDRFTRQQVAQFLADHNPAEGTDEERKKEAVRKKDRELRRLGNTKGTLLNQILADLAELKGGS